MLSREINRFRIMCVQVKIWFQNRRMKWRNSKERELLATGGSREQTLPNKNNPNPDLSDADGDRPRLDLSDVSPLTSPQRPEEQTENEEDEEINVTWWNSNEYPDANVFVWWDMIRAIQDCCIRRTIWIERVERERKNK